MFPGDSCGTVRLAVGLINGAVLFFRKADFPVFTCLVGQVDFLFVFGSSQKNHKNVVFLVCKICLTKEVFFVIMKGDFLTGFY